MNTLNYDESYKQIGNNDLAYHEQGQNQIFNYHLGYANTAGDFPAGWQKGREIKTAAFCWEEDYKQQFSIKISNRLSYHLASISQQRSYRIAVCEKQVWEVGAVFRVHQPLTATIKVHFISHFGRSLHSGFDFLLQPGKDYYCGVLTVPADVEYAYLELGTREVGTMWVSNIVFRRVFPVARYDSDARGRLNINAVTVLKKILDPVKVTGELEFKRIGRDVIEEVEAGPEIKTSGIQDVLNLTTYSFCVLNQGHSSAGAQLELSPNGVNWMPASSSDDVIRAGQMKILVPDFFLRYIRLSYWTKGSIGTCLVIFFQGQG